MSARRITVWNERPEPEARWIAEALQDALGGADEAAPSERRPIATLESLSAARALGDADAVVALDEAALRAARHAGSRRLIALSPTLLFGYSEASADVDLWLVTTEAARAAALAAGAPPGRVSVVGPLAPPDWGAAAPSDEALVPPDRAVVVVRAAELFGDAGRHDLAPTLVQLSLVSGDAAFLFDVGHDAELAAGLRRRVPGHGIDASMFAPGEDAAATAQLYRAAHGVLGEVRGFGLVRALATGARPVAFPPGARDAGAAHALDRAGVVSVADSVATLAVTLDLALRSSTAPASSRGGAGTQAEGAGGAERPTTGIARAVELVEGLLDGRLDPRGAPHGLPVGLERLDVGERPAAVGGEAEGPKAPASDDVEAELAALRAKLGL